MSDVLAPHYEDGGLRLWHGANLDILAADALGYPHALGYHPDRLIPDGTYDSVITDPPYELGFMGKAWDSSGIAYSVDVWREVLRVLKPGGYLLSFGGSRTYHRIAVAIEDAGFEIRDNIAWLYSQGFPKSMDVATAVDKLDAAAERRARALTFTAWMRQHLTAQQINAITGTAMGSHYVTYKEQPSVATADLFDQLRPHLPEVPAEIEQLVLERTVESENWKNREVTGQHEKPAAAQVWRAERPEVDGVEHATVKPLGLMQWCARLITRPGGRVLDLYAGSGTTGEAALLEGMEVDLIELEASHLPLILARVRKPLQPAMFGDWEAIA